MQSVHGEQPFWFWNGNISKDEVRRQIFSMKEGGAKGFFLHPRQGMALPYMSNHFLDMVRCAVDAAKEADMEMWLYDEYPYPSGVGGGEVLSNPDYRAHFLHPYCFEGSGLFERQLCWGAVLYAKAFPVKDGAVDWDHPTDLTDDIGIIYLRDIYQGGTGLSAYNKKRFFTGEHAKQLYWQAPQGQWKIFIFIDHEMEDFKYFGCFVDPLNKDAIAYYIQTTHERYKAAFGNAFGKTVKGIFTDETAPMGSHGILWSRLLPQLFEARNGYSLLEKLPALLEDMPIDNEKFLYDFNATVYDAFVESYDKPIRAWCEQNHLIYTGEKPHLRLEQCSYMAMAGTDNGHVKCGRAPTMFPSHYRANARAVASSNHFCADNVTLCEAYHSLGWDVTLRDMRWIVDWLGVDGVNLFVPHAFYYSEDALRKHDAPPSMFENMPWWRYNTLYTRHIETTTAVTQYGKRRAPVLVLDPMFCAFGKRGRPARGIETPLVRTQRALSQQHMDYYIIDRNLMRQSAFEDGRVLLGGESFRAIVLPGMPFVEAESRDFLLGALRAGVPVFALDCLPKRCITDGQTLLYDAQAVALETDEQALAQRVVQCAGRALSLCHNGREAASVPASVFDLDGVTYVYSVNLYQDALSCQIALSGAQGTVSVIDTVTGQALALDSHTADGAVCWDYEYAPFAPALFAVGKPAEKALAPDCTVTIDPAAVYPMQAGGDNLLRLGKWQATLGRTQGVVEPMPVIDQLLSLEGSIRIDEKSGFGCVKKLQFPPMALCYETSFDLKTDCALTFAMEPGAICGDASIFINDTEITAFLTTRRVYARGNLACDITPFVRPGKNTVRVTVSAQMDHDGLVNALYIAGAFSCWQRQGIWTLEPPAQAGSMLDLPGCGLPFYCGTIRYDLTRALCGAQGLTQVCIEDWTFEHACELFCDGVSCGARAWNPYRWQLLPGKQICLDVATTMLGAYEGCRFDVAAHETVSVQ